MPSFLKDRKTWIAGLLALCFGMIAAAAVKAEGVPKQAAKPAPAAAVVDADPSWTGFGLGLKAGVAQGAADAGGPGIKIDGQDAGGVAFYRQQLGPIVLGAELSYDRIWGDLHTFGIDYALGVAGTIGVLPSKTSHLYAKGGWLRAYGGSDHLDGWGLGAGAEQRVAGTPLSIGIEYMHYWMDKDAFGPGTNVTADSVMAVGRWQFGARPNPFADR